MNMKLLTEHHLEFLSLKGGGTGWSIHVKMPHCWKSHVMAQFTLFKQLKDAFETVSEENASNKVALLAAQQKDEKGSEMMTELTAVSKKLTLNAPIATKVVCFLIC